MRALVTDDHGGFAIQEFPEPQLDSDKVLVRVHAASVGPRDMRMARQRAGLRPGSDFAGVVEQAAGRSGPQVGDWVVGVVPGGAWAERIAVRAQSLCLLPNGVEFGEAAAIAGSGLTALYALECADSLLGSAFWLPGRAGRWATWLASSRVSEAPRRWGGRGR